jgi:hypothetical protein
MIWDFYEKKNGNGYLLNINESKFFTGMNNIKVNIFYAYYKKEVVT